METLPAPLPTHKCCTKCGETLPLSGFWPDRRKPGLFRPWCITCSKADPKTSIGCTLAWRKAHPEQFRETQRKFVERHRDRLNAEARATYAEKRREKRAAYRKANAERIKARNAEYRERNQEKISESGRAYYAANREAIDVRVRLSVAKKPELYKAINKAAKHRRRARIIANGPTESFKDREIFERDNWTCGLCGGDVDPDLSHPHPLSASLDHRVPLVKGGGHTRDNVQLTHLRCNLRKRDREALP